MRKDAKEVKYVHSLSVSVCPCLSETVCAHTFCMGICGCIGLTLLSGKLFIQGKPLASGYYSRYSETVQHGTKNKKKRAARENSKTVCSMYN